MAMPAAIPRYTLDDLDSFPNDGNTYELLDGVLHVSPGPAMVHEIVAGHLIMTLNRYLPPRSAWVFSRGSVELAPRTHLEPDVVVIPVDEPPGGVSMETRWTAVKRWWLVVEVSGRGSRVYDRDRKVPTYLALGVPEVWRVDLVALSVEVWTPAGMETHGMDSRLVWHPPGLPEPLVIEVSELLEAAAR
ncbi:MAG: Uma2 family endonuclease [Gemmatimonadales bacterium]|nr:Uma2 family endonuclease [Gemmatimonadales bacterium]